MASNFAKRLNKLERLAAELLQQHVAYRFISLDCDATLEDYVRRKEELLDQMVADGEIADCRRDRVSFARWRTKDEDAAACRKAVEAAEWSAVSEEAAAVAPADDGARLPEVETDIEDELRRKFTRPIDEIITLPSGIV
jgi:hypothetical protein